MIDGLVSLLNRALHGRGHFVSQVKQPDRAAGMFQSKDHSPQEVLCTAQQRHHRAGPERQCSR